jgi:5'-3' exonuclease
LLKPTRVVVIFDGAGGSTRRRSIYNGYKENRKSNVHLNRAYKELAADEDVEENMKRQIVRTIQYLDVLPVSFLSIDNVEADDTIAYCALQYFKKRVNIMSADKDFLQLVDDRIQVWSPTKKRMYGPAEVHSEYGIHSGNFVFYRALDGDPSDNISGIRGFGIKTVLKAFPQLAEKRVVTVDELYAHAIENRSKLKVYDTLLETKGDFERNIALMQLSDTYLTTHAQLHINEALNNPTKKLNRYQLLNMIREDRLGSNIPNHLTWVNEVFNELDTIAP